MPPGKAKAAEPPRRRGTWPIAAPARCPQVTRARWHHGLNSLCCSSPTVLLVWANDGRSLAGGPSLLPPPLAASSSWPGSAAETASASSSSSSSSSSNLFFSLPSPSTSSSPQPRRLRSPPRSHRYPIDKDHGPVLSALYSFGELRLARFETRRPVGSPGVLLVSRISPRTSPISSSISRTPACFLRLDIISHLPRSVCPLCSQPMQSTPPGDSCNAPAPA